MEIKEMRVMKKIGLIQVIFINFSSPYLFLSPFEKCKNMCGVSTRISPEIAAPFRGLPHTTYSASGDD